MKQHLILFRLYHNRSELKGVRRIHLDGGYEITILPLSKEGLDKAIELVQQSSPQESWITSTNLDISDKDLILLYTAEQFQTGQMKRIS